MHFSNVFPWLVLSLSTTAFKFTKPDLDKKLNLSADLITVSWVAEPSDAAGYDNLELWWRGNGFGYNLVKNYPFAVGVGEYGWNPKGERQALEQSNYTLSPGKDFYFSITAHPGNSSRGMGVQSEKYAVEGYGRISSGHQLQPRLAMWPLAVGVSLVFALS